jgi:hypothetical protein
MTASPVLWPEALVTLVMMAMVSSCGTLVAMHLAMWP